ncbi:MAG: hypothetical protein EAX86_02320 [Candidatus Heimdallarchaeota archaeon]|nr:hypothetical protein [Candidatus Heimdallarchaeota archaeon]
METIDMPFWKLIMKKASIILIVMILSFLSNINYSSQVIAIKSGSDDSIYSFDRQVIAERVIFLNELSNGPSIRQSNTEDIEMIFNEIYSRTNPLPSNFTGENVSIAVLDTGISLNPWISSLAGKFTTIPYSNLTDDDNGHGTFVAGIISKIAPNATIYSIKIANQEGFSNIDWFIDGLNLALDLNVSIIQVSLGSSIATLPISILNEISERNITLITSAGNSGPFGTSLTTPGIYTEVISVGMAYNSTHVATTSSSGPRPSGILGPDLIAPGVNIIGYDHNSQVASNTGTSFAAPFVTGAIALLLEEFSNTPPSLLKAILMNSAKFLNHTSPSFQGNGLLDITQAYNQLISVMKQEKDLISLAPRKISSLFTFFGHSINGIVRNYTIRIYSTSDTVLFNYTSFQSYPVSNISDELPYIFGISTNLTIPQGWSNFSLSIHIPDNLTMNLREGSFILNFTNNLTTNLSISIANRYPGGNIVFYQGYDNDTFIPSGPTGEFSQLSKILENNYGMETLGIIRENSELNPTGSLIHTASGTKSILEDDLKGKHILVLADIEFGMSDRDISVIQNWIAKGHSLIVLSYPSRLIGGWETLSNQSSINRLLSLYGVEIENDFSNLTRFSEARIVESVDMLNNEGMKFNYVGTSLKLSGNANTHPLANAIDTSSSSNTEHVIGAYWEDSDSKGKVIVFGGMIPFSDAAILSKTDIIDNLMVVTSIFNWLIRDQQVPLEVLLTAEPTMGMSTGIQIQVKEASFHSDVIMSTIIEANYSYTQTTLKHVNNIYFGSWVPVIYGKALLWLSITLENYAPTNGLYIIEVYNPATPDYFLLIMLGGIVLLGVTYYLIMSRQKQPVSPIEQKLAREFHKQKQQRIPKHAGLETLQMCPRCNSKRYSDESKYCFQCGREL